MQITEHDSLAALQRLAKTTPNARARIRFQGIVLGRQGETSAAIGKALGVDARSVREWVKRYNEGGAAALQEHPGRGRHSLLQDKDIALFRARIESGAQPKDGVCSLRGLDIQRILEEEFATTYTLNGVYRLLHRLGYSSLMPRPRHAQADKHRQEEFKKNSR